eukprot:TRINITY_DN11036_c0_g1_i1.p1 TRINITY_DN11036_c0_g1~~TRINITY_DN11036_c0_g1_i1.p1  ORF type:complete len:309 (-),score=80.71 TRINITY_DN11036_c0_g1_i1:75-1001(-)
MVASMIDKKDFMLVEMLINKKVDLCKIDMFGCNAAHYSSMNPSRQILEIISNKPTITMNHVLSSENAIKSFPILIKAGINPNVLNVNSHNAFFTILLGRNGDVSLLNVLKENVGLEVGDLNHLDFHGNSLLHHVFLKSEFSTEEVDLLLKLLFEKGADFFIQNISGYSPFMELLKRGHVCFAYEILEKNSSKINQKDNKDLTCVNHFFMRSPFIGTNKGFYYHELLVLKMLQSFGADLDVLHCFVGKNFYEEIDNVLLLDKSGFFEIFRPIEKQLLKSKKQNEVEVVVLNKFEKIEKSLNQKWITSII